MATDTPKIRSKLTKLDKSLDELEAQLEPLFAQPLAETLLALDTVQQAKLQVIIPYVVYDLVFVYLKSRGIDPKTHRVVPELERVRQYFDKIKHVEDLHQKRKLGLDKAAADRFIKHAIAQAKNAPVAEEKAVVAPTPSSSSNLERVPIKITSKMAARAQYEKELKELGSEEEDDLEIFDEATVREEDAMDTADGPLECAKLANKGKGRAVEEERRTDEDIPSPRHKRPRIDPFSGREAPLSSASTPQPTGFNERVKLPAPAPASSTGNRSQGTSASASEDRQTVKAEKKVKRKAKKAKSS